MESFSFTTAGRLEETLDYLAKMLLKKLYVNQLQANKILLKRAGHHALESGIFNFLWRVRLKEVSIVVAVQYTGYTLWSAGGTLLSFPLNVRRFEYKPSSLFTRFSLLMIQVFRHFQRARS